MSSPLVLLVARSASRAQLYRESLDQNGISCLAISGLKEVPALVAGTSFSGILLDMPVMAKSPSNEKANLEDILKALPSAYLNIAPATDSIKLLTATGTQGMAQSIEEFAEICKGFTPRLVTSKDRYPLHLSALLHSEHTDQTPIQTVTFNVSRQGCFLFSTDSRFQPDQSVSIYFVRLDDSTPITATVCWIRPWGDEGHHPPGIGIRFDQISILQTDQITTLIDRVKGDGVS